MGETASKAVGSGKSDRVLRLMKKRMGNKATGLCRSESASFLAEDDQWDQDVVDELATVGFEVEAEDE